MANRRLNFLRAGTLPLGPFQLRWAFGRRTDSTGRRAPVQLETGRIYKLHFGPGAGWSKPSDDWLTVDIDPQRGDIVMDFRNYEGLPLPDESVDAIYASHTFEHVSLFTIPALLMDCHRVLVAGGRLRAVVPDARESIQQYLRGNLEFPLFARRRDKAARLYGEEYTLFECMKEDFLSRSNQEVLMGQNQRAHQNAWDFESFARTLARVGFEERRVKRSDFQASEFADFAFEGTYPSEANERDRSLYVEVTK